jgi:hypothetical protein
MIRLANRRDLSAILKVVPLLGMLAVALTQADTPRGEEILEGLSASPKEVEKLNQGGVVNFSGESWEQSKRELAADSVVIINKPLADVLEKTLDDASLVPANKILDSGDIHSLDDFAAISFLVNEHRDVDEANELLSTKNGKKMNLSKNEVALIQSRSGEIDKKAPVEERLALASDVMREILIARYQAYQQKGLAGIDPYVRSKKETVSVGNELRLTTEMHKPIEEYWPGYYSTLIDYPLSAECCEHRFYWLKVKILKRPTWALVHRVTLIGEDFALVTERYFYTSHSLNSLQITVAWLPYGDGGTYLGLATSASADVLTGFKGKFLRAIGRDKAGELVGDVLEDVQRELAEE